MAAQHGGASSLAPAPVGSPISTSMASPERNLSVEAEDIDVGHVDYHYSRGTPVRRNGDVCRTPGETSPKRDPAARRIGRRHRCGNEGHCRPEALLGRYD